MGCFSFLCKKCNKGINSDTSRGERAKLFLLKDGKVIQQMTGEYDSYGTVFKNNLKSSEEWKHDWWELHWETKNGGIAAYHEKCWNGELPKIKSELDPDQGWNIFEIESKECNREMQVLIK